MDGPFTDIDAEAMAGDVERWWRAAAKLSKQLTGDLQMVRHCA
jgi:dynein heavy chain